MPADDPAAVKAREFIHKHGGAVGVPSWGKFWLSALGVYDWEGLNPIPPDLFKFPYFIPFHPGRMWCHARMVYLPMSFIYGHRYTAPLDDVTRALREELYCTPYDKVRGWFRGPAGAHVCKWRLAPLGSCGPWVCGGATSLRSVGRSSATTCAPVTCTPRTRPC